MRVLLTCRLGVSLEDTMLKVATKRDRQQRMAKRQSNPNSFRVYFSRTAHFMGGG